MLDIDMIVFQDEFTLKVKLNMQAKAIGIFGASGSGKTTLLNTISGLISPHEGYIQVHDQMMFNQQLNLNTPPFKRKIGYVFQDSQLFPHLNVKSNLLYGYQCLSKEQQRFQLDEIVQLLKIGHLLNLKPAKLSGGEKQRVALGRAILASPELLLLDEPLASLDRQLKNEILPYLHQMIYEFKIPILYVSHDLNELLQLTSDVIFLEQGQVLHSGHFLDLIQHESIFNLSKLVGFKNSIKVSIKKHLIEEELTQTLCQEYPIHLPLFPESLRVLEHCLIQIRPQDIALALHPIAESSIQNQIPAKIEDIHFIGRHALLKVDIGCSVLVEVSLKSLQAMKLEIGKSVFCLIKAHSFSIVG